MLTTLCAPHRNPDANVRRGPRYRESVKLANLHRPNGADNLRGALTQRKAVPEYTPFPLRIDNLPYFLLKPIEPGTFSVFWAAINYFHVQT